LRQRWSSYFEATQGAIDYKQAAGPISIWYAVDCGSRVELVTDLRTAGWPRYLPA